MGNNKTDTSSGNAGFLIPWKWPADATESATDYAATTDYTEAARQTAAMTTTSTIPLRMTFVGSGSGSGLDSTLTGIDLRVVRGGMPGVGGMGVAYRAGSSDTYHGTDTHGLLTGTAQAITTLAAYGPPGLVTIAETGTLVGITTRTTGSVTTLYVLTRASTGACTLTSIEATAAWVSAPTYDVPADIIRAPDGSLHAYCQWSQDRGYSGSVALWRSTDSGVTWVLQTYDVGAGSGFQTTRVLRAEADRSGRVVLFKTSGTGASSSTSQYVSTDGGYSFTLVVALSETVVWDVVNVNGALVCLMEDDTATGNNYKYYIRRMSDPTATVLNATAVLLTTSGANPFLGGGSLISGPTALWAYVHRWTSQIQTRASYSTDYGSTWSSVADVLSSGSAGSAEGPCQTAGIWWRGTGLLIGSKWDGTTVHGAAINATPGLLEWRMGGYSDVTASYDPQLTNWGVVYMGLSTFASAGWATATDTGVPTRTLSYAGGQRIQTGVGVVARHVATGSSGVTEWFSLTAEVDSGTLYLLASVYYVASYTAYIGLTSTGIRLFDSASLGGGEPAYTTHSITGQIEILVCVSARAAAACAWFRSRSAGPEREWTQLTPITSMTATALTTAEHQVQVLESSDAYVRDAGFGAGINETLAGGITRPNELAGIAIDSTIPTYLPGGISVVARGGPAVLDGGVHTIPVSSMYRKANMLPTVSASPGQGWRSGAVSGNQDLWFTFEPVSGDPINPVSDVWAMYLDNLESVPLFSLYDHGGSLIQTVDLRTSLSYTQSGGTVIPTGSGGSSTGRHVIADELVGGYFEHANGEVRKIRSNTTGSLASGATVAETRATIILDDTDGTEDASGTGYIWPPRALVIWYLRGGFGGHQRIKLRIASGTAKHDDDYRAIGVCAFGPVICIGAMGFDRTESREVDAGDEVSTAPDGRRYRVRRRRPQRRVEVALVDSHRDVTGLRGSSTSPDYVKASSHASALPVADRYGDPLHLEGLLRGHGKQPLVYIPDIPVDSGTGDALIDYTLEWARGAVYGEIINDFRREQIQIGRTMTSDGYRVVTIAIRELI